MRLLLVTLSTRTICSTWKDLYICRCRGTVLFCLTATRHPSFFFFGYQTRKCALTNTPALQSLAGLTGKEALCIQTLGVMRLCHDNTRYEITYQSRREQRYRGPHHDSYAINVSAIRHSNTRSSESSQPRPYCLPFHCPVCNVI